MIKPQEVILACRKASETGKRKGSVIAMNKLERPIRPGRGSSYTTYFWGACHAGWSELSDEQIYQALTWLLLEMVEFHGVPMRQGRDCLEDWVDGYREWIARCGAVVGSLGKLV